MPRQRADRCGQRDNGAPALLATKATSRSGSCGSRTTIRTSRARMVPTIPARCEGLGGTLGFDLDEADEIQSETAGKIRPAIVVGDDRHGFEGRQSCLPLRQLGLQAREECLPVGLVICRIGRIDPRQRFQDRGR